MENKFKLQKSFGKHLAQIRNQSNITQEKLSFELGVDRTYISYLERGLRNPSLFMLWKISKSLSIKLSELTSSL